MCILPRSNNIEMCSNIPKDTFLHVKYNKNEKRNKLVIFFEIIAKKKDVSQPTFESSWNSCMQNREKLNKYVAKFCYGCVFFLMLQNLLIFIICYYLLHIMA